jgi:hypothetical protein
VVKVGSRKMKLFCRTDKGKCNNQKVEICFILLSLRNHQFSAYFIVSQIIRKEKLLSKKLSMSIMDSSGILISEISTVKNVHPGGHWWFIPVTLATWEAEIRRIMF